MIKTNEFTNSPFGSIIIAAKTKEVQVMHNVVKNEHDNMMCCRMLYSRAYDMAGAFDCISARLKTMRH